MVIVKARLAAVWSAAQCSANWILRSWLLIVSIVGLPVAASASSVASCYYDELGRVIQVVAADGTSVLYAYDAAGNIVSIKHASATAIGISGFTLASGSSAASVTIYGAGFNSTSSGNTAKFNRVTATVNAASPTTLTAAVPAAATG